MGPISVKLGLKTILLISILTTMPYSTITKLGGIRHREDEKSGFLIFVMSGLMQT